MKTVVKPILKLESCPNAFKQLYISGLCVGLFLCGGAQCLSPTRGWYILVKPPKCELA